MDTYNFFLLFWKKGISQRIKNKNKNKNKNK